MELAAWPGSCDVWAPALPWHYGRYRGADMIKPNRAEAEVVAKRKIVTSDDALEAARIIRTRYGFGAVLVTLDQRYRRRRGLVNCSPRGAAKSTT